MLPCWAKAMPIPAVMTRNVPQKKESPIPDNGPISPTFRLLMDSLLKLSALAHSCSIATERSMTKGETWGVILNVSVCRCSASK